MEQFKVMTKSSNKVLICTYSRRSLILMYCWDFLSHFVLISQKYLKHAIFRETRWAIRQCLLHLVVLQHIGFCLCNFSLAIIHWISEKSMIKRWWIVTKSAMLEDKLAKTTKIKFFVRFERISASCPAGRLAGFYSMSRSDS